MTKNPGPITLKGTPFRGVIFGDMGVGKTTCAMTFPRPLVIDGDDGLISVTYAKGGEVSGLRWEPEGYRDIEDLILWLRKHVDDHDTIVIDEIGTLQGLFLSELIDEHTKAEPHAKRPLLMSQIPEQIEYLGWGRQVEQLLHYLKQLKKHVVILAGLRVSEDGRRSMDVSPMAQKIVGKWAHVVGELLPPDKYDELGDDQHRLLMTGPKPGRQAKSRFADLTPYVIDPSFDTLWASIEHKLPSR